MNAERFERWRGPRVRRCRARQKEHVVVVSVVIQPVDTGLIGRRRVRERPQRGEGEHALERGRLIVRLDGAGQSRRTWRAGDPYALTRLDARMNLGRRLSVALNHGNSAWTF